VQRENKGDSFTAIGKNNVRLASCAIPVIPTYAGIQEAQLTPILIDAAQCLEV